MPPFEQNGKQVLLVDTNGNPVRTLDYLEKRKQAALAGQVYNPTLGFATIPNVAGKPKYPYDPFYGGISPRFGMAYTLDYVSAPVKGDDHVVDKGVDVYVEPKATLFLLGTVMDFEEDMLKSGFTFKNPNQTDACGCGESVTIVPAKAED